MTYSTPWIRPAHKVKSVENAPPCRTLYFTFKTIRPENTISFSDKLADVNGNVGASMGTLTITLKAVGANGDPQFMIASGSSQWDATGGSLTYNPKK